MNASDTAGTARGGMTMSDETTRLRALLERATQTPWRQDGAEITVAGSGETVIAECTLPDCLEVADEDREEQEERNAALIVAAVNALPGLLDAAERAERAERELAVLRAQQAPLVACVDALRAAARDAGWRDADATGETLVAWVRRGAMLDAARIARERGGEWVAKAIVARVREGGE